MLIKKYILMLIGIGEMEFTEQYLIESEAQDVRCNRNFFSEQNISTIVCLSRICQTYQR
jgi:hypothetical protein